MNLQRGSGILLHVTSLPSVHGIGDLGPEAYAFIDQLADIDQKYWQILPLNPTEAIYGNSPYLSASAFAVNPLLISPEHLEREGWLTAPELTSPPDFASHSVDFQAVRDYKMNLFKQAFDRWRNASDPDFDHFFETESSWLQDYALFMALRAQYSNTSWVEWPEPLRDRDPDALLQKQNELADPILFIYFLQYMVQKQWQALKSYSNDKGIQIIGDLPIYVEFGSADVWCNPEFFKLDEHKRPYVVAGVPPDYFSKTGQRWGNPIYNWDKLQQDNFSWWTARLTRNLKLFDLVRIDHFRGLVAYWEVPAEEETAINGKWVIVPTDDFIKTLQASCPNFNVIAEDLGLITEDVKEALRHYKLPGMKVLQFAFGEDLETNPYLPHNYDENCIVYTGTHDNNTTLGWYHNDASDAEKWNLGVYFQNEVTEENVVPILMEAAISSRASVALFPLQDVLELDENARMNTPGTANGNWQWRVTADHMDADKLLRLGEWTRQYDR